MPAHVIAEQLVFKLAELNFERQTTPHVIQLYLYPTKGGYPVDTLVHVTATYAQVKSADQNQGGLQRTTIAQVHLPLSFFVQIHANNQNNPQASKEAAGDFKLNLVLNKTCASVTSLFEDCIESLNAR